MPHKTIIFKIRIISTLVSKIFFSALLEHKILGTGFPSFITLGTQLCVNQNKEVVSFIWKFK